jgi:hypothetical protein
VNTVALLAALLFASLVFNAILFMSRLGASRRATVLYLLAANGEVTGTDFPGSGWASILREMESSGLLDSLSVPGGLERDGRPKYYYRLSTRILGRPQ